MMTFMEFLDFKKVKAASGFHKGLKDSDHKIGRDDRGGDRHKNVFKSPYKSPNLYVGPQHLSIDGSTKNSKGNTPVRVGHVKFMRSKLPSEISKGKKLI